MSVDILDGDGREVRILANVSGGFAVRNIARVVIGGVHKGLLSAARAAIGANVAAVLGASCNTSFVAGEGNARAIVDDEAIAVIFRTQEVQVLVFVVLSVVGSAGIRRALA